ncbi:MAG: T9SS type A sorting domain-containing protein, partial [Flavobacteriaceae bacterium]|nr:T9SS type A sorting domain-containing protein [Flavobacteriaceae bacterium]
GTTKIQKIEQADANHNIMYVSRGSGTFYRSDDVRDVTPTFTNLTTNLMGSGTIADIATHPTDENLVYILRGNKIYKSSNKGASWIDISNGLPNIPMLEMVYDKSSNEGIYIGTDMGVYYKDASLASWIDYSNDLPVIRVSGMDIYYGATRDESFLTVSTDGRGFWRSALNDVTTNAPVANFSSDSQSIIANNSVNFSDTSTGSPMLWEWNFEGGAPELSNDQNPAILYNTPGTYKVTLKVTGLGGSDTKEIVDYITVNVNTGGSGPLQGYYNYQGNLNDDSSYSRGLTAVGGFSPTYVNDKDGNASNAYQAPGASGNYLSMGYKGIGGTNERTVTAWIKTTTAGTRKTIAAWGINSAGAMFNVMVHNGNIRVEAGSSNVQNDDSTVPLLDGDTWRHIAVTYNPADGDKLSNVKIYIDGVFYANQPDSGDSFNSEATVINTDNTFNDVQIGNANYNASYYWQGQLDDVRIYSKALTASEVMTVMGGGTLGVNDINPLEGTVKAFPNPFTDSLIIRTPVSTDNFKITVYDTSGKMVRRIRRTSQNENLEIKTNTLSPGVYILVVQQGSFTTSKKVIKIN